MPEDNGQIVASQRRTPHMPILALALWALLLPQAAPAEDMSRFQRLVVSLEQAAPAVRSRFARIALLEMAEIHLAEAGLARNQTAQDAESGRLLGWAHAVEAYAGQLLRLHEDVEQGAQVLLLPGLVADTGIVVGERSIIISHPRSDQQQALEQSILHVLCGQEDCLRLLAAQVELAPEPILKSASSRPPSWSFTRSGPVCEQSGLQIQFPAAGDHNSGNLAQYRSMCRQLFAELQLLVTELRSQQRQGVVADWSVFAISATPHRPDHSVRLNNAGDSLLLSVPLLHASPGLLPRILPWLRSRADSDDPITLVLQASEVGWASSLGSSERDIIPRR